MNTAKHSPIRVKISGGFLLLLSVIWFFDRDNLLFALLPCVLFHELGHLAAMSLFDVRPTAICADATGLTIHSFGELSLKSSLVIAFFGPFFGLSFALLCAQLGTAFKSQFLFIYTGIGLILNLFNLLPLMPLDGGRIAKKLLCLWLGEARGRTASATLSFSGSFIIAALGFALVSRGHGAALLIAGFWLVLLQINTACKTGAFGIK